MENKSFENGYKKIIMVINSCKNANHINVADNYLVLFLLKWKDKIDDQTKSRLINLFAQKRNEIS